MGYYSDVTFVLEGDLTAIYRYYRKLHCPEDVTPGEFWNSSKLSEVIRKYSTFDGESRLVLHLPEIKWYTSLDFVDPEERAEALAVFINDIRQANIDGTLESSGSFVRIGQELDDIEEFSWGTKGWNLIHLRREAVVNPTP